MEIDESPSTSSQGECSLVQNSKSVNNYQVPKLVTGLPFMRSGFEKSREIKKGIRWVYEMSMMTKAEYAKIKRVAEPCVSYTYSLCKDLDRYETVHKMMFLSHVYDFHIEVGNDTQMKHRLNCFDELCDKLENTYHVSMTSWPLYVIAHFGVFDHVLMLDYNQEQKRRLIDLLRRYNMGIRKEIHFNQSKQQFNNLEHYLKIRCRSIAVRIVIQMLEYTDNLALSEDVWNDPRWQRIMDLVEVCTVYLNDMLTFERDLAVVRGVSEMSNSVALISHLEAIPVKASMERVLRLVAESQQEFIDLGNDLLNDNDCLPETKAMVNSVSHLLGGIFELHKVNF